MTYISTVLSYGSSYDYIENNQTEDQNIQIAAHVSLVVQVIQNELYVYIHETPVI